MIKKIGKEDAVFCKKIKSGKDMPSFVEKKNRQFKCQVLLFEEDSAKLKPSLLKNGMNHGVLLF